jgi:DnaD/phage-associated family protein
MKAFGISGRNPGQSELDYINRWNSMGFESDIIIEACNRTLLATHQASFPYANRILEGWKKAGVKNLSDILVIDKDRNTKKEDKKKLETLPGGKPSSNAFHNFEQRSYDYDDLEARLAGRNRR